MPVAKGEAALRYASDRITPAGLASIALNLEH